MDGFGWAGHRFVGIAKTVVALRFRSVSYTFGTIRIKCPEWPVL